MAFFKCILQTLRFLTSAGIVLNFQELFLFWFLLLNMTPFLFHAQNIVFYVSEYMGEWPSFWNFFSVTVVAFKLLSSLPCLLWPLSLISKLSSDVWWSLIVYLYLKAYLCNKYNIYILKSWWKVLCLYVYLCVCAYVCVDMGTDMCVGIYMCMCACASVCVRVRGRTCVYVSVSAHAHVCLLEQGWLIDCGLHCIAIYKLPGCLLGEPSRSFFLISSGSLEYLPRERSWAPGSGTLGGKEGWRSWHSMCLIHLFPLCLLA